MINTIYLDYAWFSGDKELTDDDRNDCVWLLEDWGITQQFCDIGVLSDNGILPMNGTAKLREWIHMTRIVAPKQQIMLVLNYGNRKTNPKFGSEGFNSNINSTITHLLKVYDVNGIHLDIEGFEIGDSKLLNLLKLLKSKSMKDHHLSISTPLGIWTDLYLAMVAKVVDQINPMMYDSMGWGSSVVDTDSYRKYFGYHLQWYSYAIKDIQCELVPTLPSYEKKIATDGTIYHDPDVETMSTAIESLNLAIENGIKISGAGIFWGSNFMGFNRDYSKYKLDQHSWETMWLKVKSDK